MIRCREEPEEEPESAAPDIRLHAPVTRANLA